ncbi:MAG: type II secretion system protein [Desulfobacterium sp.]|nr:type II secretion system protein [Desulfobacterium sp.]
MRSVERASGFTMIELLFVIVVIGVMLAVITPRAYRANIDSKYGVVRQGAVELVSYATEWATQGMASQDREASTSKLDAYMASLAGGTALPGEWIADNVSESNWNSNLDDNLRPIPGRNTDIGVVPETSIQDMIPGVKIPVNPFNGVSVFSSSNYPKDNPITGALACAGRGESTDGWHYYALIFQGTDSTDKNPAVNASFYAGQGPESLAGLRNGIFLARER